MLDPIVKTIEVPCGQQKAFTVFLEEMDSWWPKSKFTTSVMGGSQVKVINVDAKSGGKIIEVSADGREWEWGTVKDYDPYGYFSMDFHIPTPDWKIGDFTYVEVRFTELENTRTIVELTQSNWEVLGDMAEGIREGYGHGWGLIFEQAYKAACGG